MDKNIIKNILNARFINEESTPGIDVTKKVQKASEKINKTGISDMAKGNLEYDKAIKKTDKTPKPDNKFNYNGDKEKEYHDEMEILNGQEMIQYDREPNELFKARAKESIEGSSRMGNKGGPGMGNAEATWGASNDDFGKNLVKLAADSAKKRQEAERGIISFGDDIETVPKNNKPMSKHSAFNENTEQASKDIESNKPYGSEDEYEFNNDENNKPKIKEPKIKESMKRLKFNKEFNGVGNALKMIPESYRTDNKEFEMTDGVESYRIRWEGTLSEGKAIILTAANKTMVNEDMENMKRLMGYKSQDTLGLSKGKTRLDENAIFSDIYNKTKALLEGEDIEDQDAATGDLDDAVSQAKEAKKHVEGSVSTDKGTQAPKPKTGTMESLDDTVSQAKEATKHVEGSETSGVGVGLGVKAKTGEWDKINVPQAADAKKHVQMTEGFKKKNKVGILIGESYFEEMEDLDYGDMSDFKHEGYGDDNVLSRLSAEEREEKLETQPVYSEELEMNDNDELIRKFFILRFERQPEQDISYFETWKERLNKPNPEGYMDNKSMEVWNRLKYGE